MALGIDKASTDYAALDMHSTNTCTNNIDRLLNIIASLWANNNNSAQIFAGKCSCTTSHRHRVGLCPFGLSEQNIGWVQIVENSWCTDKTNYTHKQMRTQCVWTKCTLANRSKRCVVRTVASARSGANQVKSIRANMQAMCSQTRSSVLTHKWTYNSNCHIYNWNVCIVYMFIVNVYFRTHLSYRTKEWLMDCCTSEVHARACVSCNWIFMVHSIKKYVRVCTCTVLSPMCPQCVPHNPLSPGDWNRCECTCRTKNKVQQSNEGENIQRPAGVNLWRINCWSVFSGQVDIIFNVNWYT